MSNKQLLYLFLATLSGIALTLVFLWLSAATPAQADPGIRYVALDGNDAYLCESVVHRCRTIQRAIDVAAPGDEIRVAGGTYSRVGTVAMIAKPLRIWGCYGPDFTAPDPDLYHTVLDAHWGGSVISISNANDVQLMHLTLTHGDGTGNCGIYGCGGGIYAVDTGLLVGHLAITDNVGSHAGGGYGGGVYANNAHVEIWGSLIVSNTASADTSASAYACGGGLYIHNGAVSLRENQILDNVGGRVSYLSDGGGIYLYGVTHADVLTNVIKGNKAGVSNWASDGGGLWIGYSTAVHVASNRIENNWTNPNWAGYGGGIYVVESDAHLTCNSVISNAALPPDTGRVAPGGGVCVVSSRPVTLSNNLIARNYANIYGGGVYVHIYQGPTPSRAILVNNTIADNGASGVVGDHYAVLTMTNNLIAGHTEGLSTLDPFTGTISADTNLFWNVSDPITGTHAILEDPLLTPDYHLRTGSPAVNAGLTIPWLTVDLEGKPRPQGSKYDIGAFEGEWWAVALPLVVRNWSTQGSCPGYPGGVSLITDREVYPVPDLDEPAPRQWFTDPTFGTCLVRVTDRAHDLSPDDTSTGLANEYARVQAFNADGSRLLVRGTDGTWYLYNAQTLLPLGELPIAVEPRWDADDPDVLYYSDETRLTSYNVRTGEQTEVHDFASDFPGQNLAAVWTRYEGSPSRDRRYWGLMAEDENWSPVAFVVYDRQTDQVTVRDMRGVPAMEEDVDHVTMSPLGTYFLASLDRYCEPGHLGDDAHPCGLMVYKRDLTNGRSLLRIIGHYDPALDAQGREVIIYQDIDTDHISMLDLATGTVTPLWEIDFSHTAIGLHFSGLAFERPGWAVVSTYDDDAATHTWMDDQVLAVELKPGGRVVRLAHTHSLVDESQPVEHYYWAEPHASANADLTRVLFTTNWGRYDTGEVEMFMIALPPDWSARLP